ncbi:hypothetical protein WHZ77_24810 [Bradyrhizobium sp. A5]|uniref:hypothetical protein n=1 Tax=Bradyrhizobium sp. A5 TaxID=3133696 RepID=UPI00324F3FEA
MAHQINNDGANFELSIEQLDEVAGGGWFSSATHWLGNQIHDAGQAIGKFLSSTPVAVIAGIFVGGGAIVVGGQAATRQN